MRAKLSATTLIASCVCSWPYLLAQQSSSPIADPEAERILDKAAQAEGGDNILGALRTLKLTGVV